MKQIRNGYFLSIVLLIGMANAGYCASAKSKVEKAVSVSGEKIKSKFHEGVDSLTQEKVHETIDQAADYLDKDKLKEGIDEIADYFDKEKIKEFIDYVSDRLDKEKIKEMIDVLADVLDREKIKDAADQMIGSFDKEKVKNKFDQSVDQVVSSLQDATESMEADLRSMGNDKNAVQNTIKKYNWNRWIPDQASYGPATLSDLKLGGSKKIAIAKPGQNIEGEVVCSLDRKQCSALSLYRVVLGIKNQGGQTTIFNHFGIRSGKETDHFSLTAPRKKGVYQVAFQVVEAAREGTAIQAWDDGNENSTEEPAVIGLIIVV